MKTPFSQSSPLRIFAVSAVVSVAVLLGVLGGLGPRALLLTLILVAIEITFSFDNAIINAKLLAKLSRPWQTLFLTLGVVIAVFGMRLLFPVLVVVVSAHLGWREVVNLALHHPQQYAAHLQTAHASIAAFGGAFLLLLALNFFMDSSKKVHWLGRLELLFKRFSHWAVAPVLVVVVIVLLAKLPANPHAVNTLVAGLLGTATYLLLQIVNLLMERMPGARGAAVKQTGLLALSSFIYLQILDASFSFDGVIGAFAITSDVVLIAAGLGIGALWVRSLTVYMVRRHTLGNYIYIEHGAHYTILSLAIVLLLSVRWDIADFVPGIIGLVIIGAAIVSSRQAAKNRLSGVN